jgi:hypothetical protein
LFFVAPPASSALNLYGIATSEEWQDYPGRSKEDHMRSCILWLIGVPIPIIILLWLITGHA